MNTNIENTIKEIKQEIKTLKRRVGGYKGWLKRYKKEKEELKFVNGVVCKQRDRALAELSLQKQELAKFIQEATKFY